MENSKQKAFQSMLCKEYSSNKLFLVFVKYTFGLNLVFFRYMRAKSS